MNLETKITIYKFTPQLFTLTPYSRDCFQKPGMFHCEVFTSFFYSTLHNFTQQGSRFDFLTLYH
ncbi:hypothetical protein GAY80_20995 [Phocaeicola vulgatus]|uniref:Uncharacterized protein n=1 Tax=Phocaeicola vulgatus TaxID=821 RepID=A0A7J5RC44_PHOVU|nr:hypothetical protein GAY80_20995 [Phocaeicola vulgatus]KAB6554846.1 hypothetical protein GAY79_21550 [Phocaeicola vulgatus]KAB6559940.1 hypothetical protein GAY82_20885 [Phocaeicola vulgatus]KAB6563734.1 hypothetical protein GAY81_21765 [Phocaeicola vulgatus]KAB6572551.1 hypothetical protein GAY84_21540 [Phocaeicola vulgatus]